MSRRSFVAMSAVSSLLWASPGIAQETALDVLFSDEETGSWGNVFDTGPSTAASFSFHNLGPLISPKTLKVTRRAARALKNLMSKGEAWPVIPHTEVMKIGLHSPVVTLLRRRLAASGQFVSQYGDEKTFDSFVEVAVKRFQSLHGLPVNGIVDGDLRKIMNISPDVRLSQLKKNISRLVSMSGSLGSRYVMVNIPDATAEVVDGGSIVARHKVAVGSVKKPTPTLSSNIYAVNFNPYWYVPASIVREDIIPKMRSDSDYLSKNNIRILGETGKEVDPSEIDWTGKQGLRYFFRQDPGRRNAMAGARIAFANKHSVYMHDTPLKDLFGLNRRFFTAGCIRVQNIRSLIKWLLRDTPEWSSSRIDDVLGSGKLVTARLAKPVPLHICYITAWASSEAALHFREDVYFQDGILGG